MVMQKKKLFSLVKSISTFFLFFSSHFLEGLHFASQHRFNSQHKYVLLNLDMKQSRTKVSKTSSFIRSSRTPRSIGCLFDADCSVCVWFVWHLWDKQTWTAFPTYVFVCVWLYCCVCVRAHLNAYLIKPNKLLFWINVIYCVLQGVRQSQIPDSYHEKHRDHQEDGKWHSSSAIAH